MTEKDIGKLVLVKDYRRTEVHLAGIPVEGKGFVIIDNEVLYPAIISDRDGDEPVKEGELVMSLSGEMFVAKSDDLRCKRVLAMYDSFTPDLLDMIISGTLKGGDNVRLKYSRMGISIQVIPRQPDIIELLLKAETFSGVPYIKASIVKDWFDENYLRKNET